MIQPLGTNYHRWMRWWWPEAFLRWCNIILPYYSSGAEISWNGSNKETSRKLECGGFGKKDAWWCSFFLGLPSFRKTGLHFAPNSSTHATPPKSTGGEPTILCISFWFNCPLLSFTMQHAKLQSALWQQHVSSLWFLSRATTPRLTAGPSTEQWPPWLVD